MILIYIDCFDELLCDDILQKERNEGTKRKEQRTNIDREIDNNEIDII